mmetsp:Transcript_3622/g.4148  ORF Transcript_3622/g.4148 Transcript_3622/m.4148 type:complete len:257 (+) Transcript_3622:322-1092(+)
MPTRPPRARLARRMARKTKSRLVVPVPTASSPKRSSRSLRRRLPRRAVRLAMPLLRTMARRARRTPSLRTRRRSHRSPRTKRSLSLRIRRTRRTRRTRKTRRTRRHLRVVALLPFRFRARLTSSRGPLRISGSTSLVASSGSVVKSLPRLTLRPSSTSAVVCPTLECTPTSSDGLPWPRNSRTMSSPSGPLASSRSPLVASRCPREPSLPPLSQLSASPRTSRASALTCGSLSSSRAAPSTCREPSPLRLMLLPLN